MPNSMPICPPGELAGRARVGVESSRKRLARDRAARVIFRGPIASVRMQSTRSVETPKEGNAMADPVPHSRRSFLKTLGVAGAAAGVAPAFLRSRADAQEVQLKAADPGAKPGGHLRFGILNAPAHFDVHQSGTIANLGAHAPMYDLLIRCDQREIG